MYGTVFDAHVSYFWFRDEEVLQSSESYWNRFLHDVSLVSWPDAARAQSMLFYVVHKNISAKTRSVLLIQQCWHHYCYHHYHHEYNPEQCWWI